MAVASALTRAIRKAAAQGAESAAVLRPGQKELLEQEAKRVAAKKGVPLIEEPTPVKPEPPKPMPGKAPEAVSPVGADIDQTAVRLSKANLGDYALDESFQPNFDRITTTDDVKATIADLAKRNAAGIDEARRGVITNEELAGLANDLDLSADVIGPVLARESGGVLQPEVILAARQVVNSSAERISSLAKKVARGEGTDTERILFRRQLQFHDDFFKSFMGARAETGRALNAFRPPVGGMNPAQLRRMSDLIDNMNGYDTDRLARVLSEVDSVSGVSALTRKYGKSQAMGVLNELFVNSILSGPKTFLVNLYGNMLMPTMHAAETAFAARIGRFLPGDEHVAVGEAQALIHGQLGAVADAWKMSAISFRRGRSLDDIIKYDTGTRRAISSNLLPEKYRETPLGSFVAGVGTVVRLPTERGLLPADEFFKTLAYRAEIERQAVLHAGQQVQLGAANIDDVGKLVKEFMEDTPLTAQEAAEQHALRMTFQSPLGEMGQKFERALRSAPPLTLLAPFIRTPVNIFKEGILRRSPLAIFTREFHEVLRKGGRERDLAVARVTMGSLTSAWMAYETLKGNVTGGGPQDDGARQTLETTGWRSYSIRAWNPATNEYQYVSYARLEPLAFVIGAVADTTEILSYINNEDVDAVTDEETQAWSAAAAVIAGIANNTMSKTFTKGLADFSEMMSDPARYTKSWVGNMALAFVPYSAMRRQITQIQDPYMREAWTILDKLRVNSAIPGYSADAPPRRDIFGEPRKYAAGDLLGPMSPMPVSGEKFHPVTSELVDLMKETRLVPITMPGKRFNGMRLNAEEYDQLVRYSRVDPGPDGLVFRDRVERMMQNPTYLLMTPTAKVEILKKMQRNADDIARVKMLDPVIHSEFAEKMQTYNEKRLRFRIGEQ